MRTPEDTLPNKFFSSPFILIQTGIVIDVEVSARDAEPGAVAAPAAADEEQLHGAGVGAVRRGGGRNGGGVCRRVLLLPVRADAYDGAGAVQGAGGAVPASAEEQAAGADDKEGTAAAEAAASVPLRMRRHRDSDPPNAVGVGVVGVEGGGIGGGGEGSGGAGEGDVGYVL
ncbi:uncharacterized protein G2W53_024338 [Senna tora]|uniref:Uncharacterized protein n=1 Tax=Senna tora TaxID=362788 RepID=A0A834WFD6_9FABA|nr:uncharacterized protein G2W53_024338 [Senna tora]